MVDLFIELKALACSVSVCCSAVKSRLPAADAPYRVCLCDKSKPYEYFSDVAHLYLTTGTCPAAVNRVEKQYLRAVCGVGVGARVTCSGRGDKEGPYSRCEC